jgi:tagatose-6-phosphate ketose/aldose isomerase
MSSQNLGFSITDLNMLGAIHTATEIVGQSDLWLRTYEKMLAEAASLDHFLQRILTKKDVEIILTGAGSSAFIGEVLAGVFTRRKAKNCRAVATTDIVTHPADYIRPERRTLLISFARSGNSPESVGAVEICSHLDPQIHHLIVTCNAEGKLATQFSGDNFHVFLLPAEADDQSLAMTGSFTSMLLTGLLISAWPDLGSCQAAVRQLSRTAEYILDTYREPLAGFCDLPFERAVFLGSGPLLGIAHESHLKLQELTDGAVICKYDSFLGFRHGPKAVINNKTLLVYLFSNDPYVASYEYDLVHAINRGEKGIARIGVGECLPADLELDLAISSAPGEAELPEEYLAVSSVLPAQLLGFFKSLSLGLKPDSPSRSGTITRVVEGVNIYPFPA